MYNSKVYNNSLQDNIFKQITIDGRESIIETSKNRYVGFASLYIPEVDSTSGIYILNKKGNIQEVLDIYKTIKINPSTREQPLIINQKEFTNKNSPPGLVIYENNCLDCHSKNNYIVGPSLNHTFIKSRGKNWVKKYLSSKKTPVQYNIECIQITDSTSVKEIIKYLFQE